jgi:hypothetical protein
MSMPNDKNVTMRLMHAKAGTPGKPSTDVQSYKTDPAKDVAHTITMSAGGISMASKGNIVHTVLNQDGSTKSSMTFDGTGVTWNIDGKITKDSTGDNNQTAGGQLGIKGGSKGVKIASDTKIHTDLASLDENGKFKSLGEGGPHPKMIYKV